MMLVETKCDVCGGGTGQHQTCTCAQRAWAEAAKFVAPVLPATVPFRKHPTGITAEQAERLCAYIAAASMDIHETVMLSEVTSEGLAAFSPGRVQELIREFVYMEDNK